MVAIDSSSWIAYLSGVQGNDVEAVDWVLAQGQATLPPVVLSELLSDPKLPEHVARLLRGIPLLVILDGYWERVGVLRARLLSARRRAPLADSLVAQSCIDHDVPLITRDGDFIHFVRHGRLLLFEIPQ